MMKMNQLALAMLMVFGVAACGGRSGNDGPIAAPKPKADAGMEMPKNNSEQPKKTPEKPKDQPKQENKPDQRQPDAGAVNPPSASNPVPPAPPKVVPPAPPKTPDASGPKVPDASVPKGPDASAPKGPDAGNPGPKKPETGSNPDSSTNPGSSGPGESPKAPDTSGNPGVTPPKKPDAGATPPKAPETGAGSGTGEPEKSDEKENSKDDDSTIKFEPFTGEIKDDVKGTDTDFNRIITVFELSNGALTNKSWRVQNPQVGQWQKIETTDKRTVRFSSYDNSIFGFVDDRSFTNGKFDQDKKEFKGEASYSGIGIYREQELGKPATYSNLNVTLKANFDDKTLKGALTGDRANFDIDAQIDGRTFDQGGTFRLLGAFYGKDASELAGTLDATTLDETKEAVFGAKKDQN